MHERIIGDSVGIIKQVWARMKSYPRLNFAYFLTFHLTLSLCFRDVFLSKILLHALHLIGRKGSRHTISATATDPRTQQNFYLLHITEAFYIFLSGSIGKFVKLASKHA